jgi:hypothetical protein
MTPLEQSPFPRVTKQLIERLQELFPDRCPRLDESDRNVWYKSGQAAVVRFLESVHKDQQEK